jgi:hypothetical protein
LALPFSPLRPFSLQGKKCLKLGCFPSWADCRKGRTWQLSGAALPPAIQKTGGQFIEGHDNMTFLNVVSHSPLYILYLYTLYLFFLSLMSLKKIRIHNMVEKIRKSFFWSFFMTLQSVITCHYLSFRAGQYKNGPR